MTDERAPLLPIRHEKDFFVADIFDAIPKADQASMEHPIFSLSTKPDYRPKVYKNGDNFIEIIPSVEGMASVYDRDLIIYAVSQLMAARNRGRPINKTIHMKAYDLLVATNRPTSGQAYKNLKQSLIRLKGTQINTNISTNGKEKFSTFGLIDKGEIVKETRDGKMVEIQITLSDWLYEAVLGTEVLTISKDYFRLRKTLERRVYEIARKHCGKQAQWKINLEALKNKTGSGSSLREFRRMINKIIKDNNKKDYFPDYTLYMDKQELKEFVVFINRKSIPELTPVDVEEGASTSASSLECNIPENILNILKESGYGSQQISLFIINQSADIVEAAVLAAHDYIERLLREGKPVKSRKSIIKKAINEKWVLDQDLTPTKNQTAIIFDEEHEALITDDSWKEVRARFNKIYGLGLFQSWIQSIVLDRKEPNEVYLRTVNQFAADYVRNHYQMFLEKVWSDIEKKNIRVNVSS